MNSIVALPIVGATPIIAPAFASNERGRKNQRLRTLALDLDNSYDAMRDAQIDWASASSAMRDFEERGPQPVHPRAHKKWRARYDRAASECGYEEKYAAAWQAVQTFRKAQMMVAEFRPEDMEELAQKSALAVVYEEEKPSQLRHGERHPNVIAQAVAADVIRLHGYSFGAAPLLGLA